jgi:hypothetical protein
MSWRAIDDNNKLKCYIPEQRSRRGLEYFNISFLSFSKNYSVEND